MGLDISAYGGYELVAKEGSWEGDWDSKFDSEYHQHLYAFPGADFPLAAPDFVDGVYRVTPWASIRFRAGAYSGYNRFRKLLALSVGIEDIKWFWAQCEHDPQEAARIPFGQMIYFADNEGVLTAPCAKLAEDFRNPDNRYRFGVTVQRDAWEMVLYDKFMAAFLIASNGGVVEYH